MKKFVYILIAFIFIFAVLFLLFSGSAPTSELIEETDDSQNREIMYGTIENTLPDPELNDSTYNSVYLHTNTADYDCGMTLAELNEKFGLDLSYGDYVSVTAEVSTEEIYPQQIILYSVTKLPASGYTTSRATIKLDSDNFLLTYTTI